MASIGAKFLYFFPWLFLLAACGATPESHYYALTPSVPRVTNPMAGGDWALDGVTIPAMLDRPQMVIKSGANGIRLMEYDRWAEPLDTMAFRILNDDLALRAGLGAPAANDEKAPRRIAVTIDELDADGQGHVVLAATWTVKSGDEVIRKQSFRKTLNADAGNAASVVAAMSILLGELADAIACGL